MKVVFDYLDEFERGAKALRKKYPSFESDYDTLMTIYDKSDIDNVSDAYIRSLVRQIEK